MDLTGAIDGLEKRAFESIKAEQGDYIVDGLLFCGKCHTAKQTRVVVLGQERTPMCLCKCGAEQRDREEQQRKREEAEREFYYQENLGRSDFDLLCWLDRRSYLGSETLAAERLKILKRLCFPEATMREWTFANDDRANEKISNIAANYVANFSEMREKGKGLLFYGSVGTGKTYAAACIANALTDKGTACLVTNFARLRNTIQGMFEGKQEYIDSLNRFDLLVIDDLASESESDYMKEIVFNIIDSRYRAGLPLIITTNLTGGELKNSTDIRNKRIYSRLFDMCIPLEVTGVDRRREKLKDDFKEYAGMLGL